jgi:hypothetical protein
MWKVPLRLLSRWIPMPFPNHGFLLTRVQQRFGKLITDPVMEISGRVII